MYYPYQPKMSTVIEKDFLELQQQTTHVLVGQKVLVSEEERIDSFLDKINEAKATHKALIPNYRSVIEAVVEYLESDRTIEELITISESINNVIATTRRLIKSLSVGKAKECFIHEMKEYKILLHDIIEILEDIEIRVSGDKEMNDLLANV